jgi:hypothetical protein
MSAGKVKYNHAYWMQRAEEMRSLAEILTHPDTIQKMLGLAETYERLAEHALDKAGEADSVKDQSQE